MSDPIEVALASHDRTRHAPELPPPEPLCCDGSAWLFLHALALPAWKAIVYHDQPLLHGLERRVELPSETWRYISAWPPSGESVVLRGDGEFAGGGALVGASTSVTFAL